MTPESFVARRQRPSTHGDVCLFQMCGSEGRVCSEGGSRWVSRQGRGERAGGGEKCRWEGGVAEKGGLRSGRRGGRKVRRRCVGQVVLTKVGVAWAFGGPSPQGSVRLPRLSRSRGFFCARGGASFHSTATSAFPCLSVPSNHVCG